MTERELSVSFEVRHVDQTYAILAVYVGPTAEARDHAGSLTVRLEELAAMMPGPVAAAMVIATSGNPDLVTLHGALHVHTDDERDVIVGAWRRLHGLEEQPR